VKNNESLPSYAGEGQRLANGQRVSYEDVERVVENIDMTDLSLIQFMHELSEERMGHDYAKADESRRQELALETYKAFAMVLASRINERKYNDDGTSEAEWQVQSGVEHSPYNQQVVLFDSYAYL